jgi:hypothetical protein
MTDLDKPPIDPAAARAVQRVRRLMLISGVTTLVAIAAILVAIGYRLFKAEERMAAADVTANIPKNARVIATAASGDRIVVTLDVGGTTEIRTYHVRTLEPAGRLRFVNEP